MMSFSLNEFLKQMRQHGASGGRNHVNVRHASISGEGCSLGGGEDDLGKKLFRLAIFSLRSALGPVIDSRDRGVLRDENPKFFLQWCPGLVMVGRVVRSPF